MLGPEMGDIMGVICTIGGAAGSITAIIGVITALTKGPKNWLTKKIKGSIEEVIDEKIVPEEEKLSTKMTENQEKMMVEHQKLVKKVDDNTSELRMSNEATIATIRHEITDMYRNCIRKGYITELEKKDLSSLYEMYSKLGGNSYVHDLKE